MTPLACGNCCGILICNYFRAPGGDGVTAFLSEGNTQLRGGVRYRDGFVELPAGPMHYVDYGGEGEVVVALHGYVQNAHAFDGLAQALVPHVRLLAMDMRGRGDSFWGPRNTYRMNYYLQDMRQFFETLNLLKFALIGTSMGGTLALLYAMAHPFEVTRLVLNDIVFDNNRAGVVRTSQRYGRAPAKFATMRDALAWFQDERDNLGALGEEQRSAWVSHFLIPIATGGFRFKCDPELLNLAQAIRPDLGPAQQSYRRMVGEQAGRLRMPVLILRGGKSDVVLPAGARQMANMVPCGRWSEVPNVGHCPTLYEPVAQRLLRDFFEVKDIGAVSSRVDRGD
jgi:esterase